MGAFIVGFATAIGAIGSIVGIIVLITNLRKNNESDEKKWHYLDVNRGRYLCSKHGSFCDSSDNYTTNCPICGECKDFLELNHLDRVLQIIRNIQGRSMNRFYILYGIVGALGLFSFFNNSTATAINTAIKLPSGFLLLLASICFFLAFICYLASMAHVRVTRRHFNDSIFGTAEFEEKTIADWESYMVKRLNKFELAHKAGNWLLCISGLFIIVFLFIQLFSS